MGAMGSMRTVAAMTGIQVMRPALSEVLSTVAYLLSICAKVDRSDGPLGGSVARAPRVAPTIMSAFDIGQASRMGATARLVQAGVTQEKNPPQRSFTVQVLQAGR